MFGLSNFDGFLVRGLSGILIGLPLADKLKKGIVISRKSKAHSHTKVETSISSGRLIFVDDLISSGNTRDAAYRSLNKKKFSIVGCLLYGGGEDVKAQLYNTMIPLEVDPNGDIDMIGDTRFHDGMTDLAKITYRQFKVSAALKRFDSDLVWEMAKERKREIARARSVREARKILKRKLAEEKKAAKAAVKKVFYKTSCQLNDGAPKYMEIQSVY